jgi:putative DNA primase/helicase
LASLVNAGWTPDHPIPRTVNGKQVLFQVFCPKIIVMRGRQMEPTTASRFIWCKVWAKLEDEDVEDFDGRDCEAFEQLRRKFTRWAADNAAALKTIKPTYPPRFNNRLQKNWRLLLAIAELAGGEWPKRARRAAVILTDRRAIEPSDGVRLLVSLDPLITRAISGGRKWLTSEEIITSLKADTEAEWREYRGKSRITERQIAWLLRQYDIYPSSAERNRGTHLGSSG